MTPTSLLPEAILIASATNGAGGWVVWSFFVFLGLVASLVAVVYALRARRSPFAIVQSIGGGAIASTSFAGIGGALGTQIDGLPTQFTWAFAAVLTGAFFFIGVLFWGIATIFLVQWRIVGPIEKRYGKPHGVKAWIAFFHGVESLRHWIDSCVKSIDAAKVWDEFACATEEVHDLFEDLPYGGNLMIRSLVAGGKRAEKKTIETREVLSLVRSIIEPPVERLCSHLRHTSLNFTVWRVHQTEDQLEHLASFPEESGHEQKEPLQIWAAPTKSHSGCLAAEAMLTRQFMVATSTEGMSRRWIPRSLGVKYDAIACMPIPYKNQAAAPWGVLCIESRDGTIPLDCDTMRNLAGRITDTLHQAATVVMKRTIDQTRAYSSVSENTSTLTDTTGATPTGNPKGSGEPTDLVKE